MEKNDALFVLVKSLTKSEKRQFKLYAVRLGGNLEKNFMALFNVLDKLDDWTLVRIAVDKLHGYTNEEIADRLDMSLRSVERKLRLIRTIWAA